MSANIDTGPAVRRTVWTAAALVAGQLALCSVIGWLVFGDAAAAPTDTSRALPPAATLAGPPQPPPPAVAPAGVPAGVLSSAASSAGRPATGTAAPGGPPSPRALARSTRPHPDPSTPALASAPAPATTTDPPPGGRQESTAGPPGRDPTSASPPTRDGVCPAAGQVARAADGTVLHCAVDRAGRLRWRPWAPLVPGGRPGPAQLDR